uniref:CPF-like cuticular protein 1 n=1 Tax=Microplitis mediator TaxID=375433 RepID=A0A650DLQ8_9HYME|nr:CPF-like cuticular protein 1 [Microplitis mediator]
MAFKLIIICAFLAGAQAHSVSTTSDNIYRSNGNLAQVSTESKTVETPYSSSSKSDVRVSNPSVYTSATPAPQVQVSPATYSKTLLHPYPQAQLNYPTHQYHQSYAAPTYYSAPVAKYEVPVAKYEVPVVKYATPVAKYVSQAYQVPHQIYQASAPSVYSTPSVYHHEPVYAAHQSPAPSVYAAPQYYAQHVAQPVVKVAYSP